MTQPAVTITELDGALGVLPPSAGRLLALVGVSDAGPSLTPAAFARPRDIIANYTAGPLVEASCRAVERYGKPVVLVRSGATTVGAFPAGATVVRTGTGTSVVTADVTTHPNDDYEAYVEVIAGGTIGVTGITLQYSLDGGRTMSATVALGTASNYVIPGSGGVKILFAAGTLVAGDTVYFRCTAPNWNAAEVKAALDALAPSTIAWELAHVVGPLDGSAFDSVELAFASMKTAGKNHAWIGHFRMPTLSESEAAYLTAFNTAFSARATVCGAVCAGAAKTTSSVSGRKYRRPISFEYAAREASLSEEQNSADVNLGALIGVSIRDENGNPDEHDESVNPGLDDSRAVTLRTWEGLQGIYVNRPRILSAAGSDFQLVPHRRVLNIAEDVLRAYFVRRANRPVRVDATTGFILEQDALEIEAGALALLRAALLAKPKASAVGFALSRTDNLLSTKTFTGEARVTPLAYPEFIALSVGFLNPALQVQAV